MGTTRKYYSQTAMVIRIITDLLLSKSINIVSFSVRWLTVKKKKEFYTTSMVNAFRENSKMTKNTKVYKLIKKSCILDHSKKD